MGAGASVGLSARRHGAGSRVLAAQRLALVGRRRGTHRAAWWWEIVEVPPPCWQFVSRGAHLGRRPGITVSRAYVDPDDWTERLSVPIVSKPLAVLSAALELEQARPGQGIALVDRVKTTSTIDSA